LGRVLVYTPDLIFFSQIKGVVEPLGWTAQKMSGALLPAEGVHDAAIVVDCNRDLETAYRALDAARNGRPRLVLACYQHKHTEVAEEAIRRGATEAVRRGAILSRLVARLGDAEAGGSTPKIYGGEPLDNPGPPPR
jgi:hypothetical protein